MEEINKIKSVRVMADYASSGIWLMESTSGFKHSMIEHKDLGITKELSQAFDDWINKYGKRLKENLDSQDFDRVGKDLACKLKKELPEVRVFYAFESRDLEEEEII